MNSNYLKGLVVYGDIGIDIHLRASHHPSPGQDAKVDRLFFEPGGSAANCAAVAAYLGIPTIFIGFVGDDTFGELAKSDLLKYGVSSTYLRQTPGQTGITIAIIDSDGERTFYSFRGVNANCRLNTIPDNLFNGKKFLHISGYSFQDDASRENALLLIKHAKKIGSLISLDPSFWYSEEYHKGNPHLLSDVDIIFPNKEEALLLTGSVDPCIASRKLREMGPEIVIITLGQEGCFISSKDESLHLPAIPTPNVIDTTGAGDAFCGGFLAGQIMGLNIKESAIMGNIASSKIIEQIGGHHGAPSLDEMCNALIDIHANDIAGKILRLKPD